MQVYEYIDFLLSRGLDINATDNNGNTVLHCVSVAMLADKDNNLPVLSFLISRGADLSVLNNFGFTASGYFMKFIIDIMPDKSGTALYNNTIAALS